MDDNKEIVKSKSNDSIGSFCFNPIMTLKFNEKTFNLLSVSNGSLAFGYTKISSILKQFIHYQHKIVSVGSGVGYLEKLLEFETGFKFILVDPDPFEQIKLSIPGVTIPYLLSNPDFIKFYRKPNFKDIKELTTFNKNLIGRCDLMLIWPIPGHNVFDMDSITTLKPNSIFILYGDDYPHGGCSGGVLLHFFISCILGRSNDELLKKNSYLLGFKDKLTLFATKYKVVYQCESKLTNGTQTNIIKMLWLNLLPYCPISSIDNTITENFTTPYSYTVLKNYSITWKF